MTRSAVAQRAIDLYASGLDLRQVGAHIGRSHEGVRKLLLREGARVRPRLVFTGKPVAMSPLAVEIFADLEDTFTAGASVNQLIEWLGDSRQDICRALNELHGRAWVNLEGGIYTACIPENEPRRLHDYDTAEVERLLTEGRLTYPQIADALKISKGVVAGVAFRMRKRS